MRELIEYPMPMEVAELRTEAWIGDAVLALCAREWILKHHGRMSSSSSNTY